MADQQVGNVHGLPIVFNDGDTPANENLSGTDAQNTGFSDTDMLSISAMRTRLAAIDAGYYTAAQLDSMSYNDMVYAIRLADHPTTIKQ